MHTARPDDPSAPPRAPQTDLWTFLDRYHTDPYAVSAADTRAWYQQVTPQLAPDAYEEASRAAFARMSPAERQHFVEHLAEQARQQGYFAPDLHQPAAPSQLQDPAHVARVTTQVHQDRPGLLAGLLGGSGTASGDATPAGSLNPASVLGSPLAKAALGGIAAFGISRLLGGGAAHGGGLLRGGHGSRLFGGEHGGGFFGGGHEE